ncbi:MAG: polyprenyl synthetase family protein [Alphaproteobacteria bacterium]
MGLVVPLSQSAGQTEKKNAGVDALMRLTRADMERVNTIILDRTISKVDLSPQLSQHLISSGGKRLRPMLTVASGNLCGHQASDHLTLAASVEFLHTATLLHDDVVDESDMRRGKVTARNMWGNEASVLVGDFLLGQSFKMMVEVGNLDALRVLSNAAAVIAEGEVMQITTARRLTTTEDDYLSVIDAKTAALFSAAAEVGAVVAKRPQEEWAALRSYGRNLGLAFQLADDALDYSGSEAELGKAVGDDFREGKITLPIVLAYRRGGKKDRAFWERTLGAGEQTDDDLIEAIGILEGRDAITNTLERARHFGAIAVDALGIFPESDLKSALVDLVGFAIIRTH